MKLHALRNFAGLCAAFLALCLAAPIACAEEATEAMPAPETEARTIPPPPAPPRLSGSDNGMADVDQDLQGLSPKTRDLILTVIEAFRDGGHSGAVTISADEDGRGYMDYIVIITAIVLFLGFPPIVISIILYFGYKRARLRYDTIVTLAEKGLAAPNLDPDADARRSGPIADLRKGVVALALGAGLALFFHLADWTACVGIGAIPAFIGIAHLFVYYTRKSEAAK